MKTTIPRALACLLLALCLTTTLACRDDGPGYATTTTGTSSNAGAGGEGSGGDRDAGAMDTGERPDTRSPQRVDVLPDEDAPEIRDVPLLDAETIEDIVEDVGVDVEEDVPTPDGPPPKVCALARARVASCYEDPYNLELFDEPCTNGAQRCLAECMAGVSCSGGQCSFDNGIDCDGWGAYGMCTQRCNTCADDSQCVATYDCCAGGWSCTSRDNAPITCDVDCTPLMEPPPSCGCEEGVCGGPPEREPTICEDALARVEACGHDLDAEGQGRETRAALREMRDGGACDRRNACLAGCVAYGSEDPCHACHFGPSPCERDPLQECINDCDGVDAVLLCDSTGGRWGGSSCECCGGPTRCGEDPTQACLDPCCGPPQCVCPEDAPFWSDDLGCIDAGRCE